MFSRLASTNVTRAVSSLGAVAPRIVLIRRTMSTAAPIARPHLVTDYTEAEKVNFSPAQKALYYFPVQEQPFGGLGRAIGQYGWYPFITLGLTGLISKELVAVDIEFMMACNFILLITSGYILLGETVAKFLYEHREEMVSQVRRHDDLACALIRYDRKLCEKMTQVPAVLEELKTELVSLNQKVVQTRDFNQRVAYHNSIVAQLEQQQVREVDEASRQQGETAFNTLNHLVESFQGPRAQALRDAVLKEALEQVGVSKDDAKAKHTFATIDQMVKEFTTGKK